VASWMQSGPDRCLVAFCHTQVKETCSAGASARYSIHCIAQISRDEQHLSRIRGGVKGARKDGNALRRFARQANSVGLEPFKA